MCLSVSAVVPQPVYANMAELREMAALKEEESAAPPPPPPDRVAAPAPAPAAAAAAAAVAAAAAAAANLRNSGLASGTQQVNLTLVMRIKCTGLSHFGVMQFAT